MATILRRVGAGITQLMLVGLLIPVGHAAPSAADAQAAQTPSERTASPPKRPGPRLLSPEEKRLSAVEPGQLRPAQRPVPQVRIPLGPRGETDGQPPERPQGIRPLRSVPATAASATGRIDDEAARCEAQASEEAVKACRLLGAKAGKGRAG